MPLLSVSLYFFGKKMHIQFGKVQNSFSQMSGLIQESISGIRVIKAFNQERAESDRVADLAMDYCGNNIKLAKLDGMFHPFLRTVVGFSIAIVIVFGGKAVINGEITIGEFIAFNSYLGMLIWPMIAIGWIVNMYQRGSASMQRLNKIFETVPEINDETADLTLANINGNIQIRNLTFSYNENSELIFNDISTGISQGQTLAVVGRTGSGKSTLIDLITRIYNPPRNTIFLDDRDIYDYPLEVLRSNIIMVPQEIFLFSDTIRNNIRLGRPDAADEEVIEVAKKAQVYDDIMEFDYKFDTIVGERGVTLSGGQKQRIAIARALLCDPAILVLDDSLSAVDTSTEKNILEHIIEFRRNKTTIIISHRISSIAHADRIIVLDKGIIAETGIHENLQKSGGLYHYLYEKQKLKERIEEN